jgi:hypothetical protein
MAMGKKEPRRVAGPDTGGIKPSFRGFSVKGNLMLERPPVKSDLQLSCFTGIAPRQ